MSMTFEKSGVTDRLGVDLEPRSHQPLYVRERRILRHRDVDLFE